MSAKKSSFFSKAFFAGLILLLLLGYYFAKNITKYSFYTSHDGDFNLIRSFVAFKALTEGQFPLRWAGSLNQFCGIPIFNFYYPLLYYLTSLLQLKLSLPLTQIFTHTYFVAFLIMPLGMYLWLQYETKKPLAALIGALIYFLGPYHFVNLYVRGTTETLAYTLLPFVFLFTSIALSRKNPIFLLPAAALGTLYSLSHNLVVLMSMPLLLLFIGLKIKTHKNYLHGLVLLLSFIGLSAFFWFPLFLEVGLVKLSTSPAAEYLYHFPSLRQLLYSPWGFFYQQANAPLTPPSGMNLGLGIAQWLVIVGSFILLIVKRRKLPLPLLGLLSLLLLSLFFITRYSSFFWENLSFLRNIQYPWRILGISLFLSGLLAAALIYYLPTKISQLVVAFILIAFAIYGNRNHHLPHYVADESVYTNLEYHLIRHGTTTIADEVLPVNAPSVCKASDPLVSGRFIQGSAADVLETSGQGSYSTARDVKHDLLLRLSYYPKLYTIKVNDQTFTDYQDEDGKVLIKDVDSKKGLNQISWRVSSTPLQTLSNIITLATAALLLLFIALRLLPRFKKPLPNP